MKWIHWTAQEPKNGQWILAYQDEKTINSLRYRKSDIEWEKERIRPFAKRKGWTWWMPLNELPRVGTPRAYTWWKEEPRRTEFLQERFEIKKDAYFHAKMNCPICNHQLEHHDTTEVNGEKAYVCFGIPERHEAAMLWIQVRE